ncbi:hypothetical protein ABZP36_015098 [Zizania latifolia]
MPVRVVDTATPSSQTSSGQDANAGHPPPPSCSLLSAGRVVTFWEGEIVDAKNYTFFTGKWEASPEDDIRHWSKFPSFTPLLSQIETDGGKSLDLSNYAYIFMKLELKCTNEKHSGFTFSSYELQ